MEKQSPATYILMLPLIPLMNLEELSGNFNNLRLKGSSLLSLSADTPCSYYHLQVLPAIRHLQVTFLPVPWTDFLPSNTQ